MRRTGGQILVNALRTNGCRTVFGVPGESYLSALDALHDVANEIGYVTGRQEGGSAFMACAYADLTGDPGICFVTRGPGATNASIGLHTASQGSTPLILLVGQVPTAQREREAFQEIDYRRMFAQVSKWVAEIDDPARIPEFVNRAYRVATSGRPGPVVLVFPEDVLAAWAEAPDLPAARATPVPPTAAAMREVRRYLAEASRPLLLLGGTAWTRQGHASIIAAAEQLDLPVAVGFRRQGLFPNDHPNYVGNLGFGGAPVPNAYAAEADLLIAVGTRLGDGTTLKFKLIPAPLPGCHLVHVHPGPEELGRLYQADLPIQADPNAFAEAMADLSLPPKMSWSARRTKLRAEFEKMADLSPQGGPIDMGEVMRYLNRELPRDAIVTTGAGNASDWPNIHYSYRSFRCGLAPISGAMGFGVPAAVAAKVAAPERIAVYIGGDGDFLMNGQEMATAVQYGLDPIFVVIDNGMYGTIRMHQERRYPGRLLGTELQNPDFAAVARGYGGHGEVVESTDEFAPAFERARDSRKAAIIHVKVGPESFGPNLTLADMQSAGDEQ
jgi:acetolactate synthase I/II/III large subunit